MREAIESGKRAGEKIGIAFFKIVYAAIFVIMIIIGIVALISGELTFTGILSWIPKLLAEGISLIFKTIGAYVLGVVLLCIFSFFFVIILAWVAPYLWIILLFGGLVLIFGGYTVVGIICWVIAGLIGLFF